MPGSYDITFWQNSASIHQAPLISALAAGGAKVRAVVPDLDHPTRRLMGWQRPDYGDADLCVAADLAAVRDLAGSARADRAHVFTGLGSSPTVSAAFRTLQGRADGHLSVMTESWDPRGVTGALRRARYAGRVLRWGRHVDSLLAIGELAAAQFVSVGIPPAKVAPFLYTVSDTAGVAQPEPADVPEVVFVGSLEPHKDPLSLVEAMAAIESARLTMVGSGSLHGAVRQAVGDRGLEGRVRLVERLDNLAVRHLLGRCDLLVLPSRYDGWGAVTSEALMAGTPAVVSDRAGSSILVADSGRGRTFRSGDVRSLTRALEHELAGGPVAAERRERIRRWALARISPQAVARYLRALLLEGRRDAPPWLRAEVSR